MNPVLFTGRFTFQPRDFDNAVDILYELQIRNQATLEGYTVTLPDTEDDGFKGALWMEFDLRPATEGYQYNPLGSGTIENRYVIDAQANFLTGENVLANNIPLPLLRCWTELGIGTRFKAFGP